MTTYDTMTAQELGPILDRVRCSWCGVSKESPISLSQTIGAYLHEDACAGEFLEAKETVWDAYEGAYAMTGPSPTAFEVIEDCLRALGLELHDVAIDDIAQRVDAFAQWAPSDDDMAILTTQLIVMAGWTP